MASIPREELGLHLDLLLLDLFDQFGLLALCLEVKRVNVGFQDVELVIRFRSPVLHGLRLRSGQIYRLVIC